MSRPWSSRSSRRSSRSFDRINGRIRAREVRVVGSDGQQVGVMPTAEALTLARSKGLDLVEVASSARPPVCRIVDYGKYRYEQSKKQKENRKHQHSNRVKEVQLRPSIDPHDFEVKTHHAIEFLCDDMKVKVTLRFRGRENAHKEFGFKTVQKFIDEVAAYGTPDASPRLAGRSLNVMISPLPQNKRAPRPDRHVHADASGSEASDDSSEETQEEEGEKFVNNPFSSLDTRASQP